MAGTMSTKTASDEDLTFSEVTVDRIADFHALMANKGCWCMYWRLGGSEFESLSGDQRRERMEMSICSGQVPGIMAYADGMPVGWCSVAPRETFPRLSSSRTYREVDSQRVWSIVCFYVKRKYRDRGMTAELLREAISYSANMGAKVVEAYPLDVEGKYPYTSAAYTGFIRTFIKAGFVEVARRSGKRPVMRYTIRN